MTPQIKANVREVLAHEKILPLDALAFAIVNIRPDGGDASVLDVQVSLADLELSEQFFGGRNLKFSIYAPYDEDQIRKECRRAHRTLMRRVAVAEAGGVHSRQRPIYEQPTGIEVVKVQPDAKRPKKTEAAKRDGEQSPKRKRRRRRRKKGSGQ